MTPKQYARVRELFLAARERDSESRAEFLANACAGEEELHAEVLSLLASDDRARTFLRAPALGTDFALDPPRVAVLDAADEESTEPSRTDSSQGAIPPNLPESIGQYRILGLLGRGGMGEVYRAEQQNPPRTVALKVIRSGLESHELLKRFEYESHVLARLQHPGIAQIFEAGTADTGSGPQPFFAMELIEGKPLTQFADARGLGTRERLELLARVCDAVHHAHQKGVIHRDLKPGNILVSKNGRPRILDFGVARATDADIRTTTLRTDVGQLIGTIGYMSPEQVGGESCDLDTRSDVYALGVIGFELLTGRLPHDVSGKTIPHSARMIAEEEPASLSSINHAFRGDVAAIIHKALAKEKEYRYQSASDLAVDIRNYLSDQPISARPITTVYQLRKFARRNTALVTAVTIALVLLCGALIHVTIERRRATFAERLAAKRLVQVQAEADKVRAINQFFNDMLASVDPNKEGRDVRVADVLHRAAEDLEARLADQPEIEASLQHTIGTVYVGLGLFADAERFLRAALAIRTDLLGNDHSDTMATRIGLASALNELNKWAEAEDLIRETLRTRRGRLGPDHEQTLDAMNALAAVLQKRGKIKEAAALWHETLGTQRRVLPADHPNRLVTMNNLAQLLKQLGKPAEAEPLLREALKAQVAINGEEHPNTLTFMSNLAAALKAQEKYDEAEQLARNVIEIRRRTLGDHPSLFTAINNLARLLRDQGKPVEAEPFAREAMEGLRRILGEDNRLTLIGLNNLASLTVELDRPREAEVLYVELLRIAAKSLPSGHWMVFIFQRNHAECLAALGRFDEAEPLLLGSFEDLTAVLGAAHQHTRKTLDSIIEFYEAWDKREKVAKWRATKCAGSIGSSTR